MQAKTEKIAFFKPLDLYKCLHPSSVKVSDFQMQILHLFLDNLI